jgi:polyisoprenoid-binding protein YceI
MKVLSFLTVVFTLFSNGVTLNSAESFDAVASSVSFEIDNFSVNTVYGSFGKPEGIVQFNPENLGQSKIDLRVSVKSINTDNSKRDEHLQTDEYFNSAAHPYIRFKTDNIQKKGDEYVLNGTLTIKGISKTVRVPALYSAKQLNCAFSIDRYDYDVGDSGGFTIGREVRIRVKLEMSH